MTQSKLGVRQWQQMSTPELKQMLLERVRDRDSDSISQKVQFYSTQLQPIVEILSQRNPIPDVEAQVPAVMGIWASVWSTIPFQDIFPGRLHDQSYQIFHPNGYYANLARYAPSSKIQWLQRWLDRLFAYDFMIVQKFAVENNQWQIQNIGISQRFQVRAIPLSIERAEAWFTEEVQKKIVANPNQAEGWKISTADQSTNKKLEKAFRSIPQLEHLYIDPDFRIVKSQREAKQRPSYTIATRLS